jgi:hypothetical protein
MSAFLLQSGDGLLLQTSDALLLQVLSPEGIIEAPGPLYDPNIAAFQILAVQSFGLVELPGPLVFGNIVARHQFGIVTATSPLGAASMLAHSDFAGGISDLDVDSYVMDLTTPGGVVRVPMSSWQATLQSGRSNYLQCVVSAAQEWADDIADATVFTIYRSVTLEGQALEHEMGHAPVTYQIDQGPSRYTATISGYTDGYPVVDDPEPLFDRTLFSIRSITTTASGYRVRCAVDWLLRPGQRAFIDDSRSFVVAYINYYVAQGDAYMDVGERG